MKILSITPLCASYITNNSISLPNKFWINYFRRKDRKVETHIYLCLIAQAVIGYIRRELKEKGWLSKVKENTLVYFFEELNSISIGKFNINNKEVFAVQRENPLKDLLLLAFNIKPFDYKRDKKLCSI